MKQNELIQLRSVAEAHLFVAAAKADGIVSKDEKHLGPVYASQCKSLFDLTGTDAKLKEHISEGMTDIIGDTRFRHWDANNHLDEAMKILEKLKVTGDWSVSMIAEKIEHGIGKLARLDGYTFRESSFLKEMLSRLNSLK